MFNIDDLDVSTAAIDRAIANAEQELVWMDVGTEFEPKYPVGFNPSMVH